MPSQTLRVDNCSSHCTTPSERHDDAQMITVKVGCLHINPASARGRRLYMLQMLFLTFVPHAALILQNCSIMAQLYTTLDSSLYLQSEQVRQDLSPGMVVAYLQQERLLVAETLFAGAEFNESVILDAVARTDSFLDAIAQELVSDQRKMTLYHLREDVLNIKGLKRSDLLKRISVYQEINSVLLLFIVRHVKCTAAALCRQLAAYYEFIKSTEELSLGMAVGFYQLSSEDLQTSAFLFQRHLVAGLEHLGTTQLYLEVGGVEAEARVLGEVLDFFKTSNLYRLEHEGQKTSREDQLVYLQTSKQHLRSLAVMQERLWNLVTEEVEKEVWAARRTMLVGVVILSAVVLVVPVLILLIRHTVQTIQTFSSSIEISTRRLVAEKQKSDLLLSRMLPIPVLRRLRAQRSVPAEAFDAVTIFFSDIVGFTNISANSTPLEVINMLNMLYRLFDEKIKKYNVYKVETIGDAYMVASGLPQRNGNLHASEIADMSLSLMRSLDGARVPHRNDELLQIRAGVNTGPCVAGVVGATMPRYCLFGDTINTASRMESTGEAMKIHISATTKAALDEIGGYEAVSRAPMDIQGKGLMETFWLLSKIGAEMEAESPRGLRLDDYDQSFLELLID